MPSSNGSINHHNEIINNLLLLLKKDSFDVKLFLSDGIVVADRDRPTKCEVPMQEHS